MFKKYIDNFNESINGLRDFVELIHPFLSEHEKKVSAQHVGSLKPLILAHKRFLEKDAAKKEQLSNELKEIFEGDIEVYFAEDKPGENSTVKKRRGVTFNMKGDTSKIDEALVKFAKSARQKELLYQNSLISLLSTVEWFFSQILHFHYDKFPDSAGIKKKTLTLEELKSFGSVSDAENYLIDDKIESIVRGSFKDWIEVLKTELSLKITYIKQFEDELIEIYQRRNLLVHNGGTVNSIYNSKVSDIYKRKVKLGERIDVSEDYLERAIALLHTTFILIACELWKKLEPDEELRCKVSMELGYEYLEKEQWDISEIASIFLCADKKMPIASRTAAQLNYWLAKKRSGKIDEVKKEIDEADFSDKSKIFQLALNALREEVKPFFALLPQVIKTEELTPQDLLEFPVFKDMRSKREFKAFLKENEVMKVHLKAKKL